MMRGDTDKCSDIQKMFSDLDGIDRVTINPVTGSIVINYEEELLQPWEILNVFKKNGYLDASTAVPVNGFGKGHGGKAGEAISKALVGWAVGKVFEGSGLSILASFI
jgi:hypothetical protein